MVKLMTTRKARFQAAIALAGMTQEQFALKHGGVSRTHLNRVLNGRFDSLTLTAKVDEFIAQVEAKARAAA